MSLYVDRKRVLDVSKERGLFVNTIRQSKNSLLDPEDEGLKILRNPDNYLAVGTAWNSRKLDTSAKAPVRGANLALPGSVLCRYQQHI